MPKRILILSGPTHEYIDPVRFIGNASSGKMGKAIAEEAVNQNYEVEFITGPVATENIPDLKGGHIHHVVSADDMLSAARKLFKTVETIIFAAAVSDYAPIEKRSEKMAKTSNELPLHLRPTPDIAKTLCAEKGKEQIAIGFALQTMNGEINAQKKLKQKNLDGIVLNTPATLGSTQGTFSFLSISASHFDSWGSIEKPECAKKIFEAIRFL